MSEILQRIQKLLRLSESGNPNEAANALALAQKLMERHRISRAEVEEDLDERIGEICVSEGHRFATWRQVLLADIAQHNHCATYIRRYPRKSVMTVIGTAEDREVCSVLFRWIERQIYDMGAKYPGSRVAKNNFRRGATCTVCERLKRAAREARRGASSTALAKIDNTEAIQSWVEENMGKPREASKDKATVDLDAFLHGLAAGHTVDINAKKAIEDVTQN